MPSQINYSSNFWVRILLCIPESAQVLLFKVIFRKYWPEVNFRQS